MNNRSYVAFCLCLSLGLNFSNVWAGDQKQEHKTLKSFNSEAELDDYLKKLRSKYEQAQKKAIVNPSKMPMPPPSPMMANASALGISGAVADETTKGVVGSESVTNNQSIGVDEGGIVKNHGKHVVILRRGRLFTIDIGNNALKTIDHINAFAPDMKGNGAWYDEMLISGDTIVVIGYSYASQGTEINRFHIDNDGKLSYLSTHHLRSNDYYSSRNYASRLVGNKLVFYTPLNLNVYGNDLYSSFPAYRNWQGAATPSEFKRIAPATQIYRTDEELDPTKQGITLHSVTICDLAGKDMDCHSSAVMGHAGSVFYVSPSSVYVWTVNVYAPETQAYNANVFRIPLNGDTPSALKTQGSPIDQMSFLERDGYLNVLLTNNGFGSNMWGSENNTNNLALMRVALNTFSDGKDSAPQTAYKSLPQANNGALQNRYVGDYLLYGAGTGWGRATGGVSILQAVRYKTGEIYGVPLDNAVDRIEALGNDALVVGSDGKNLHFKSIALQSTPLPTSEFVMPNAAQGETRTHGFFYKPNSSDEGVLGLPIIGSQSSTVRQLHKSSAGVLFLRNQSLNLSVVGQLNSQEGTVQDNCIASCTDWYGNSRPLFLKNRVFALMGYEIVEGKINRNTITEVQRLNYAPSTH